MAAEVVWLDQAIDDLSDILEFISAESPKSAAKYIAGLRESCERLRDFPQSSRVYNGAYRCLVFRNHLVFHRYDSEAGIVSIAMIVDAMRDVDRLFEALN